MRMPIDATQPYDDNNIFARILRGEIPCEEGLRGRARARLPRHQPACADPYPGDSQGAYVSWDDFSEKASDAEIAGFVRAVGRIAREAGLVEPGYRLLANVGLDAGPGSAAPPRPHLRRTAARADAGALAAREVRRLPSPVCSR